MSSTSSTNPDADASRQAPTPGTIDAALSAVSLPVSDVNRAEQFEQLLGRRPNPVRPVGDALRVVQLTPLHSPGSIAFGKGLVAAEPRSAQRLLLVVTDIDAAHEDLIGRGVNVSEVFHLAGGPVPGPDPEGRS